MKQFVTFKLDNQLFGIEILYVREINQVLDVTPVEHSENYIRGLINLRGQIVTIFDIGLRLGLQQREMTKTTHNVIIKMQSELNAMHLNGQENITTSDDPAGLLIDTFDEVIEVEDEEVEPPPANIGELETNFISGVVKSGNKLFTILDVGNILEVN